MPFKKGESGNPAGRNKGKQNKTTDAVKQIYLDILTKEQQYWPEILEKLRDDDSFKYMMVMDKLASKVVANKKDITSDGEQLGNITITEITKK